MAKGKKKKQQNKKVKKKHVHKKIKLRILSYYKVGEKVARLKKMCEVCPPGTFLAEHEDRLYCGRCRSTYTKVVDKSKVSQPKKKQPKAEKPKVEEVKEAPKKGKKGKK